MKALNNLFLMTFFALIVFSCSQKKGENETSLQVAGRYQEPHRLQFHFSPDSMWMNDPNGLVYYEGEYHLFYQYYPDSTVWGPMHWGHAISEDLINWRHLPIALYPDEKGYIFSGSAVVDKENTSGLGTASNPPLVAIFTYHDPKGEKEGKVDYQSQGVAYSTDKGRTWTKYEFNPVLANPGIQDFRDPKVMWYEPDQKWIMSLAVSDHIGFYSSVNLLEWNFESEFGAETGAHGGVWECPDLFSLSVEDTSKWVLLVSINPGGLQGGSATQYFIGDFDGKSFVPEDTLTRWMDYGMDNYAGVTFTNTEDRRVFIGWMSNWMYGQVVPTDSWRSAMTLPRELSLTKVDGKTFLKSEPVTEFKSIKRPEVKLAGDQLRATLSFREDLNFEGPVFSSEFSASANKDWKITLSNDPDEKIVIGFHAAIDSFYVDRTASGREKFHEGFFRVQRAPRLLKTEKMKIELLVDVASLELFADDGLTVMTDIFFPSKPYEYISFEGFDSLKIASVKGIW